MSQPLDDHSEAVDQFRQRIETMLATRFGDSTTAQLVEYSITEGQFVYDVTPGTDPLAGLQSEGPISEANTETFRIVVSPNEESKAALRPPVVD